jgi:hypothetical protein
MAVLKNIWSWLIRNQTKLFYVSAGACAYDYWTFLLGYYISSLFSAKIPSFLLESFFDLLVDGIDLTLYKAFPDISSISGYIAVFGTYIILIFFCLFNIIFNKKWWIKLLSFVIAFLHSITILAAILMIAANS